jgi:hypothetical protein
MTPDPLLHTKERLFALSLHLVGEAHRLLTDPQEPIPGTSVAQLLRRMAEGLEGPKGGTDGGVR